MIDDNQRPCSGLNTGQTNIDVGCLSCLHQFLQENTLTTVFIVYLSLYSERRLVKSKQCFY